METIEKTAREKWASDNAGRSVAEPEVRRSMAAQDWLGWWPEVCSDGTLTGSVVEGGAGYTHVAAYAVGGEVVLIDQCDDWDDDGQPDAPPAGAEPLGDFMLG